MSLSGTHIAIIGAGIGGLAAARALALRGAEVRVLEQAAEIREVGAGLQVSPNGMAVLRGLGLDTALKRTGAVRAEAVTLCNHHGEEVLPLDVARHGTGGHYCVYRADLIDVLAQGARAAGARIGLMHQAAEVHGGARPEIVTMQGARVRADVVIGADGLHSRVRPALNGAAKPFFTRQVAWRAMVEETGPLEPEVRLFMGPGRHLVTYPLRGGRARNIVAVYETPEWTEESWSQPGDPAALRALFAGFGPEVRELLSRVETVGRWGLFRHPVARRWHDGGLALLGDAAHPTLPFMAQGACLALEDAWVLAETLDGPGALPDRLAAYQDRRARRAARIVGAASRNAWKYHVSLPPLRAAGHLALRLGGIVAPAAMVRQFDWIYREDVTGGAVLSGGSDAEPVAPGT
ncbi:FAD-dependent monooxygenase [Oceanicola sp. 22II-s10i]|uniref:FAD-dependent monooxygenase n=1 Tax=Oceanicola sp. 22II-s10i TaxID=1317116 RepID=UPI000B522CA5|nr:FAD-dependent monooxygenase [Oceanicola sp. 22II-s10i]